MNRYFRLLVISLFIVGFPLGSWYYLQQGFDYRLSIIEELKEPLGEIPNFSLVNQMGEKITNEDMYKNVVVANFLSLEHNPDLKEELRRLHKIQDQFDKKDDIYFYTFVKADDLQTVQAHYNQLEIKEGKQWHFLTGEELTMKQFIESFPFPDEVKKSFKGNSTIAIVDTSGTIRQFYNMKKDKQYGKLVEHIAHLMPQAPPEEARMKRELEK